MEMWTKLQNFAALCVLLVAFYRPAIGESAFPLNVAGDEEYILNDNYDVQAVNHDGQCVCRIDAPAPGLCSDNSQFQELKYLSHKVGNLSKIVNEMISGQFIQRFARMKQKFEEMQSTAGFIIHGYDLRNMRDEIDLLSNLMEAIAHNDTDAERVEDLHAQVQNLSTYIDSVKLLYSNEDSLKKELADLDSRLGSCKEQYAFHVTESSQSDLVPDFFHGAHNISVPVNCGKEKLSSISEPWTHRWMGTAAANNYGAWFKDPLPAPGSENKIYYVSNPTNQKSLYEYANYKDFISNRRRLVHTLTHAYGGTGFAVYNNSFYYSSYNSQVINRYDLTTKKTLARRTLTNAGKQNTYPYSVNQFTDIDLEVDEVGMWAVYSTAENQGAIVITQLDPVTLALKRTWNTDTSRLKKSVGNAFFICGVMYATSSHNTRDNNVFYAFDTNTSTEEYVSIPMSIKYQLMSQLSYNYREKVLFGYDYGHMISYPLKFASQPGAGSEIPVAD
ncbi:PREDICTED: noelin-2-like [Priapulus caudatus]|uniref:Noelin-2-like n=1 Tax=Priapulus caudatus TaxID=37621 RepID=A0ABM1EG50_PRICU|nr:PREDICTED: noelin-2-like [Priapulus caudatus]